MADPKPPLEEIDDADRGETPLVPDPGVSSGHGSDAEGLEGLNTLT